MADLIGQLINSVIAADNPLPIILAIVFAVFLLFFAVTAAIVMMFVFIFKRISSRIKTTDSDLNRTLDRLEKKYARKNLDLEKAELVGGIIDRDYEGVKNAYDKDSIVLGETGKEDIPVLNAVGFLKNYNPFSGKLIARFDSHELIILLQDKKYSYFLDNMPIGSHIFSTFSEAMPDYLCDAGGNKVFWHDRKKVMFITHNLSYRIFSDANKTKQVATLNRESGKSVWVGSAYSRRSEDTNVTYLSKKLSLDQKALILGYLLIDLLFNE
jgi:hypothetical protein